MAALSKFYNFVIAAAKRHVVALGGIVVTAATGILVSYFTHLLAPVGTFLSEKTAETMCQARQMPISNDSQFIILVSSLRKDPDGSHTEKVKSAFHGEKGFLVVPICESVGFDYKSSKDVQTVDTETVNGARDLIKKKHADLLLFGEVSEQGKAIKIWAVNESGGCDLHPKPTIIEHGDLPGDFSEEQKDNLIRVSLKGIQSACLNQSSIVWSDFAQRMTKMEMFLNHFHFNQAKSLYFASSYIEATRLLYSNGQGDPWFSKGDEFAKRIINKDQDKDQESSEALSSVYFQYAVLLDARFDKTKDKTDQDASIGAFDKAIGFNSKDKYAYNNRGLANLKKGDWDRAIEDYTKAIGLEPKDAFAYRGRGIAYGEKGDWDRAIEDYTKAIGLDSNNAPCYERRGEAYSNKGEWDRAIDDFNKAIALDPEYGRTYCYCHRAVAYLKKGDWDRAIEDFTNAIAFAPEPPNYINRGLAYSNKGDLDRGIEDYTKAIILDPKLAVAYTARGDAYSGKGDWARAIEDYSKAITLDPKDAAAYTNRGGAYEKKGDRDRAIEDYTKAIDLSPKDAESAALWNSRCMARAVTGQLQKALSDCNQALDLQPNDADTRDSRGFVYLKMGKLEDAIADYNTALGLNPRLAASLYGRGIAKLKKGDTGNSDIESAKRIEPDIADTFQRYGIQVKQLSQSPPGSRTSRAHRPRQQGAR